MYNSILIVRHHKLNKMKIKSHRIYLVLFLLFGLPSLHLSAQSLPEQYDVMMSEHFPSDGPGAAVLVSKGDEILYEKGFGMANMELGIDIKPNQVFEIGSITKQFTAVSILMLLEEGKLGLEDDITKYIEDYPTDGNKISIHHLLTHTSGIKKLHIYAVLYGIGKRRYDTIRIN